MLPFDPDAHAASAAAAQVTSYATPLAAAEEADRIDPASERGLSRPLDNEAKWQP